MAAWFPGGMGQSAESEDLPVGLVLVVGNTPVRDLLQLANKTGRARWQGQNIEPMTRIETPPGIAKAVASLRRRYYQADFLRCLGMLQQPELSLDRLLEHDYRAEATQVAITAAACAHGAGQPELARDLLRRLLIQQVDLSGALGKLRPDFQKLVEQVRSAVQKLPAVVLTIDSRPQGARVSLDGGAQHCEATPCQRRVIVGEHLVAVQRLGYARRTARQSIGQAARVLVSLDTVDAAQAKQQLARNVGRGRDPGRVELARLAALAFGAQVVALVWNRDKTASVVVYDRNKQRIVSRVSVAGAPPQNAHAALRAALREWYGATREKPFYARPVFYLTTAGVAVITGLVMYFVLRSDPAQQDIVFR